LEPLANGSNERGTPVPQYVPRYRGASLRKNSPSPKDHQKTLGIDFR